MSIHSGDTTLHEGVLLVHGIQPRELPAFHEGGEMHEPHFAQGLSVIVLVCGRHHAPELISVKTLSVSQDSPEPSRSHRDRSVGRACGVSRSRLRQCRRSSLRTRPKKGSPGPWPHTLRGQFLETLGLKGKRKLLCHTNTQTPVLHKQVHLVSCQLQLAPREVRGLKRAFMGIAAMMSSIDRSLGPEPTLAPPSDSFAAMEERFAKSA